MDADWRVLIVEDDAKVASIHRRLVDATRGFTVTAVARSSEEGLRFLFRSGDIHLILLDITLPGANGVTFLRTLRRADGPEVIAVTASREPTVVREILQLGVVDYLVKPFAVDRLQQALGRARDRILTLGTVGGGLRQAQIDALTLHSAPDTLPKGLNFETLRLVRAALDEGDFLAAIEIAERASVARVTARRYLEYLVTQGESELQYSVEGAGRPRKLYRLSRGAL